MARGERATKLLKWVSDNKDEAAAVIGIVQDAVGGGDDGAAATPPGPPAPAPSDDNAVTKFVKENPVVSMVGAGLLVWALTKK